jgi:hypothetical protein
MEFEKSSMFKLPRIGADAEALRSIEAVLAKSGHCAYRYYQDAFDSLDALLAGRELPLDRIDLDAPAATVCIERSGVTVHHRPAAHDTVRELQAAILKHEIAPLARLANFYQLMLFVVLVAAWIRDAYDILVITIVVSALLHHVATPLEVKKPIINPPFGMRMNQQIIMAGCIVVFVLLTLVKQYFRQGG